MQYVDDTGHGHVGCEVGVRLPYMPSAGTEYVRFARSPRGNHVDDDVALVSAVHLHIESRKGGWGQRGPGGL